ncbi:decaprenyl-phosphate phosphoribosyltransferase [Sedimentisphaera salicampi]|uniref:Decaprenyl-phosphate phosphoribosyltransferase n=1 Tax=Sedimentisphaera salicampi TaxID=1941349 RepID=A0A1W6LPY9_9BACT|nr:decaprenyl-phosphate phosphoribosyltransferase [Sedimentisphaera salicampi]ARN57839.1 Decaprenyl-phosphate phosphoribosyltransferase [Sedimentisphaera salicampi]OXU14007.1 Decaprenyl-phosphate phosphoribosyltransferase [Sedimentisphaera salicampi]
MKLPALVRLLRPAHWVKNGAVILPVIFAGRVFDAGAIVSAAAGFVLFCMLSSAVYSINDVFDAEEDRHHPKKRLRPVASGQITPKAGLLAGGILAVSGLALSILLGMSFLIFSAGYFFMQLLYSAKLKSIVLLDVIIIALGFVLRASAGAEAISVAISPWLFVCMFTLCLFMGFCKRYSEMVAIEDSEKRNNHRSTMQHYTPNLLTHLITLSGSLALMAFLAWSTSPETIARIGSEKLVYTFPLIVYGTFRFALVSMRGEYEGPVDIVLKDVPFTVSVAIWCVLAIFLCNF